MTLRFKLQLVVVADDQEMSVDEIVVLNKEHERLEQLGLTLTEAKTLLLELQRQISTRQIAAFLASRVACPTCGRPRGIKDHKTIGYLRSSPTPSQGVDHATAAFTPLPTDSTRPARCGPLHQGPRPSPRSWACPPRPRSTPDLAQRSPLAAAWRHLDHALNQFVDIQLFAA